MKIRIAIADDHPMIIKGLQNMLAAYKNIQIIATYADGAELLEGFKKELPDVLLLDIQMPGQSGDELAPIIIKKYPTVNILTLTNLDSTLYVHNMLRHGVQGYVLKTTDEATLIKAIETVYNGEEFLEPAMKEKIQSFNTTMRREVSLKPTLTSREKEILQLIVNGHTGKDIAKELCLGFRTVEHYRVSILMKLGVNNTAMLVKKALKLGLAE